MALAILGLPAGISKATRVGRGLAEKALKANAAPKATGKARSRGGLNATAQPVAERLPQDVNVDPRAPQALRLDRPISKSPTQNAIALEKV